MWIMDTVDIVTGLTEVLLTYVGVYLLVGLVWYRRGDNKSIKR